VLIHAAAGGVGTVAVQLARLWGATVIGTASERNHAYLRSLGAIPVAYGPGLVERVREVAPQGVSAALDAIGGDALHASLELVKDPERIGTLVDFELADRLGVRKLRTDRRAGRLQELVDLVARGALRITISGEHPLAGAADARRAVERRHGRGKIVIVPTADGACRRAAAGRAHRDDRARPCRDRGDALGGGSGGAPRRPGGRGRRHRRLRAARAVRAAGG